MVYLIQAGTHKVFDARLVDETYHKAGLIALVEALDRFNRPAKIVIHLQDIWIATMLEKNAETWQFNGWRNKKKEKVKNWEYWQRAYNKLRLLNFEGKPPEFRKLTPVEQAETLSYIKFKREEP